MQNKQNNLALQKLQFKSLIEKLNIFTNPKSQDFVKKQKIKERFGIWCVAGCFFFIGAILGVLFVALPILVNASVSNMTWWTLGTFIGLMAVCKFGIDKAVNDQAEYTAVEAEEVFTLFSDSEQLALFFKCLAAFPLIQAQHNLRQDFQSLYSFAQEGKKLEFYTLIKKYFDLFLKSYEVETKEEKFEQVMAKYDLVLPQKTISNDLVKAIASQSTVSLNPIPNSICATQSTVPQEEVNETNSTSEALMTATVNETQYLYAK